MKPIHQDGSKKGTSVISHAYFDNVNSVCKNFINNQFVKSCLITGRQWDSVMRFVNGGISGTGAVYKVTVGSSSRHTGSQAVAGANRADLIKNIYDLEGNMREATSELCTLPNDVRQFQRRAASTMARMRPRIGLPGERVMELWGVEWRFM